MPKIRSVLSVFAIVLAVAPVAAHAAPATPEVPGPPSDTAAWTATLKHPVVARSAPRATARPVAKLDAVTAFWRRTQRLLVLSEVVTDASGQGWVRVRLPERPNRSSGFVRTSEVTLGATSMRIVVRIGARSVELWKGGRRIGRYRAAVGTSGTPTPTGMFAIQDPVPSLGAQRGYLGPYILTLTAYSPVLTSFMGGNGLVAIHGTNASSLLGQAVSHGCIRISNEAVSRLYTIARPGVPVEIVR